MIERGTTNNKKVGPLFEELILGQVQEMLLGSVRLKLSLRTKAPNLYHRKRKRPISVSQLPTGAADRTVVTARQSIDPLQEMGLVRAAGAMVFLRPQFSSGSY